MKHLKENASSTSSTSSTTNEFNTCGICLEETDEQIPGCKHFFHDSCIGTWYMSNNSITCPMCRRIHPQGHDILTNLWCKAAFAELNRLIQSYVQPMHEMLRWQSNKDKDENVHQKINKLLPMTLHAIHWIVDRLKFEMRFTRTRSRHLGMLIQKTRQTIIKLQCVHSPENARHLFLMCQFLNQWHLNQLVIETARC